MTPRPRIVNIVRIRVDHHCQFLGMFASVKYERVKLSVMCTTPPTKLRATTTSFLLQGTLKLQTHLLILLRLGWPGTKLVLTILHVPSHTAPSYYPVCTHTCLRQLSSRSSLSLFNGCFLPWIRIRVCPPPLISCRSYISSMRSKYYAFAFFDG